MWAPLELRSLFERNYASVWRLLRRFGVLQGQLDDAVQGVFWVAARRLSDIQPEKERSFLYGVALRVASNEVRRRKALPAIESGVELGDLVDVGPGPQEQLEQRQARELLDAVLDRLERTVARAEEQRRGARRARCRSRVAGNDRFGSGPDALYARRTGGADRRCAHREFGGGHGRRAALDGKIPARVSEGRADCGRRGRGDRGARRQTSLNRRCPASAALSRSLSERSARWLRDDRSPGRKQGAVAGGAGAAARRLCRAAHEPAAGRAATAAHVTARRPRPKDYATATRSERAGLPWR
jgi:RNA polymerase sigma factor (sigma-70 family)